MFPTPMITDGNNKKRGRDLTLRPDRELPVAKLMCVEPVPMDVEPEPMEERAPFVFLPIPQLIRCVNVAY
jgi:hypothetical protein